MRTPPPAREFWPFMPRPEVLTCPEPCPRPTRLRFLNAPFGERRSSSCIVNRPSCRDCDFLPELALRMNGRAENLALALDLDQMAYLVDHAAHRRVVRLLNHLTQAIETERLDRFALILGVPDKTLVIAQFQRLAGACAAPGALRLGPRIVTHDATSVAALSGAAPAASCPTARRRAPA